MDIFEELHAEHEEVSKLIAKLEQSGRDERTFATLRTELTAHSKAEEQVLYKRLEDEESVRDTVLEGYEEHEGARPLLAEGEAESLYEAFEAAKSKLED